MRAALALLALTGCPMPDEEEAPREEDDDAEDYGGVTGGGPRPPRETGEGDADVDADVDADADADTGVASLYWTGHVELDGDGGFVSGSFGVSLWGMARDEWVCTDVAVWTSALPGPGGCPSCLWSFTPVASTSSASGSACASLGFEDGDAVIGAGWPLFAYPIGYAPEGDYSGYSMGRVIYLAFYDDSWYPFIYDGGAYTSWVDGAWNDLTFGRYASTYYYYYYTR